MSRIMIASAKMWYYKIPGSGADVDEAVESDEIIIANVHMSYRTAKRDLRAGGQAYKRFWDLLAT